ncbi:MAG: hypothetical protein IT438_08210 [Phycisphaerales bacterium]|nr:hypothetical protein [Phycisphaerales bacterium]
MLDALHTVNNRRALPRSKPMLAALVVIFVLACYPVLALIGFAVARACLYQLGSSEAWGAAIRISPGFSRCYFDFNGDIDAIPPEKSLIFHVTWYAADSGFIHFRTLDDKITDMFTFDRRYRGADHGTALRLALTIYASFLVAQCFLLGVGCAVGNFLCRLLLRPTYWARACVRSYRRGVYYRAMCYAAILAVPVSVVVAAALLALFTSEHYTCLPGLIAPSWYGMGVLLAIPGVLVSFVMLRVHSRRVGEALTVADSRCVCDYPCAPGDRCPECGRVIPSYPPPLEWSWRVWLGKR